MALTIEEIFHKVDDIIEAWKPFNPDTQGGKQKEKDGRVPYYYPLYPEMVEYQRVIKPHAEKGCFPEMLFKERSPNQTEKEHDYVRDNFKQKTLPVFMDFVNVISRAFNDGNWSIEYQEDDNAIAEEDSFRKYVEEEIPVFGSIENYVKTSLPAIKLKDANGVIAIKPINIERNEETGELMNDVLVDPVPFYYESHQVVDFEDGVYFIIETGEKSVVQYGNRNVQKGKVFEVYDDMNIWRVYQVGKWQDFNFDIELIYGHEIEEVPVTRLKGVPQIIDNEVLYQSPFLYAVDNLDLVLLNSSNLQLSINNCVYPYRVMVGDICDFEDNEGNRCDKGTVYDHQNQSNHICPKCNGSGLRSRVSPLGVMLLKPPTQDDEISESNISTPMQYISPDTGALEFLRQQIMSDELTARRILHLTDSTTEVQGQEDTTATGRAIDQKQMFSFIKPISDQMFEIWAFILDAIGEMRYGSRYKQPTLTPSVSYDFLTSDDYLVQINEAVSAGLPPFVIHTLIFKYLNSLFYSDAETAKVFKLVVASDRFLTHTSEDLNQRLANGTIAKWEAVLHDSAVSLIKEIMLEDEGFMELDLDVQREKLIELAKVRAEEVLLDSPVGVDTDSLVDQILGGTPKIDDTGKPINPDSAEGSEIVTPTDAEAEAKAKLKGTVGGVQGIIQINQAVARGEMTERSAELLLEKIYGFDASDASRLIDPPSRTSNDS